MVVADSDSGTKTHDVPNASRNTPALTPPQLGELVAIAIGHGRGERTQGRRRQPRSCHGRSVRHPLARRFRQDAPRHGPRLSDHDAGVDAAIPAGAGVGHGHRGRARAWVHRVPGVWDSGGAGGWRRDFADCGWGERHREWGSRRRCLARRAAQRLSCAAPSVLGERHRVSTISDDHRCREVEMALDDPSWAACRRRRADSTASTSAYPQSATTSKIPHREATSCRTPSPHRRHRCH